MKAQPETHHIVQLILAELGLFPATVGIRHYKRCYNTLLQNPITRAAIDRTVERVLEAKRNLLEIDL